MNPKFKNKQIATINNFTMQDPHKNISDLM